MRYGSVCSGIEAATMAWHPLGWTPVFFSEIEKFPSAVLSHHYGSNMPGEEPASNGVPNLGDMTRFEEWPAYDGADAIDLLVGGTPCQDYSVAGQRLGMAGSRGQLTLVYVEILGRYRPRWFVWENVPGVLSSNDGRDFARFLGELTGQVVGVPAGGWKNAGIVSGIADAYGCAYRVLDAQFTRTRAHPAAVPQRRRRVFVVGYLGDWRPAAAVLLDAESLCGNSPPRREAGERVAGTLGARTQGGGGLGTDLDLDGGLVSQAFGGGNTSGPLDVSSALTAHGRRQDFEVETFIADAVSTLPAGGNSTGGDRQPGTSAETAGTMLVAHTLRGEGCDASEDGSGRGTPLVPVAFDCKGTQVQFADDGSHPTLRSMGHAGSHQNAGGHAAVAIQERAVSENLENGPQGKGFQEGIASTLEARNKVQAVATQWAVRRLLPRECERLQAFPDDYTLIPWRGKPAHLCPDGPRYKAHGNSMAVNVMEWLGERIDTVERLIQEGAA